MTRCRENVRNHVPCSQQWQWSLARERSEYFGYRGEDVPERQAIQSGRDPPMLLLSSHPIAGTTEAPRRRRFAFTLVEVLTVMSILGLLVALLLPAVMEARGAAR